MADFLAFWTGKGLSIADLVVLGIVFIGLPIIGEISMRRYPPHKYKDDPDIRLTSYNLTILMLWSVAGAVMITWLINNRSLIDLGFIYSHNLPTYISTAVALLISAFFMSYLLRVAFSGQAREKLRVQVEKLGEEVELLMPRTAVEHRRSMFVAITAGITEEIIFRGYLIWVFNQIMPIWGAGIISILIFVFLHRYQEKDGLVQVAGFAVIATIMYIASGSLWPVIFLHIMVDVLMLSATWVMNSSDNAAEAA